MHELMKTGLGYGRQTKYNYTGPFKGGIHFSTIPFEVSFLSVITLLPMSVIYHLKAYGVNFQNLHII